MVDVSMAPTLAYLVDIRYDTDSSRSTKKDAWICLLKNVKWNYLAA